MKIKHVGGTRFQFICETVKDLLDLLDVHEEVFDRPLEGDFLSLRMRRPSDPLEGVKGDWSISPSAYVFFKFRWKMPEYPAIVSSIDDDGMASSQDNDGVEEECDACVL